MPRSATFVLIREDFCHPLAPGPKARRITAWLNLAHDQGAKQILTAGGMHSNHLHALACLAQEAGLPVRAWVRGLVHRDLNPILVDCAVRGMELVPTTRQEFDELGLGGMQPLVDMQEGEFFIPMGAGGAPGMEAMAQLYRQIEQSLATPPDWLALTAGTGAILFGLLKAAPPAVRFFVAAPFKNPSFLLDGVDAADRKRIHLVGAVGQTRFGKSSPEAVAAAHDFTTQTGIGTDNLYMPNLLYQIREAAHNGLFGVGETVAVLHCGGSPFNSLAYRRKK